MLVQHEAFKSLPDKIAWPDFGFEKVSNDQMQRTNPAGRKFSNSLPISGNAENWDLGISVETPRTARLSPQADLLRRLAMTKV